LMNPDSFDKGVSPIIAAIVLMAIVVSVASIVGPWFIEFVGERTERTGEIGEREIGCMYADLYIRNVHVEENEHEVNLTMEIENTGDGELSDFWTEVTHEDATISHMRPENYDQVLREGSRRTFVAGFNATEKGNASKITFYSEYCPGEARDELEEIYFEYTTT